MKLLRVQYEFNGQLINCKFNREVDDDFSPTIIVHHKEQYDFLNEIRAIFLSLQYYFHDKIPQEYEVEYLINNKDVQNHVLIKKETDKEPVCFVKKDNDFVVSDTLILPENVVLLHAHGYIPNGENIILIDYPTDEMSVNEQFEYMCVLEGYYKYLTNTTQIIISTNSPFLISDSKRENVVLFEKQNTTNKFTSKNPEINTFGASVNNIMLNIFEQQITVGKKAYLKLESLKDRSRSCEPITDIIQELYQFGDSVEKTLLLKKILLDG